VDERENPKHESVDAWAKRLYFAARAVMDSVLRPYGLGSTQWYVLCQLANEGPTMQRDLVRILRIERATLSGGRGDTGAQGASSIRRLTPLTSANACFA